MTNDVRQWLGEIKLLKEKLAEAQQERDEAYASAANWRKLYETEAKQRRTEANLVKQQISALEGELAALQNASTSIKPSPDEALTLKQELAQLDVEQLKEQLAQALLECDRFAQALKQEQESHAQTRKGLTTALGDTVDMLTKERAARSHNDSQGSDPSPSDTALPKNPSLELPPLDPAQFLV